MDKMFSLVPPQEHAQLAEMIPSLWHSAYDSLLGKAQVDYMTQKFQSAEAIRHQIMHENYIYFYILSGRKKIGYCAIEAEEEKLFLSKLYLKEEERGKGLGQKALAGVTEMAKRLGLSCVYLTVNKGNARAIAAYEKFGFVRTDSIVTDIGGGYVMDDYVYVYPL